MSVLFYRRPTYSPSAPGFINSAACQRYVERTANAPPNIPDGLSFEAILANKTLPPCTLGDFMDYLMYIANDAETLQFFLWYKDYCERFDRLDVGQKTLSKEWRNDTEEILKAVGGEWPLLPGRAGRSKFTSAGDNNPLSPTGLGDRKDTAEESVTALPEAQRHSREPSEGDDEFKVFVERSVEVQKKRTSTIEEAAKVNVDAGLAWTGFSIQPYRAEVTRIITHYLAPSAPRRLNLPPAVVSQILHALQHTTHPSAFIPAIDLVSTHLRHHSHPNFIRWSICNGNKPRVFFVRIMGISNTIIGFLIAILLTLSRASRWYRIFAALEWFIGISTLIAAYKGLCIILHASGGKRALKPWEDPAGLYSTFTGPQGDLHGSDVELEKAQGWSSGSSEPGFKHKTGASMETFGTANDSYKSGTSTTTWVDTYNKKSVLRKVFDKSVSVQDSALRVMQDSIVRQAQLLALLCTLVLTVIFVALPAGNYY